jgi:hypothetical protein
MAVTFSKQPQLHTVMNNLKYALRSLRKNPLVMAIAIGSLGLGIGANTADHSCTEFFFRACAVFLRFSSIHHIFITFVVPIERLPEACRPHRELCLDLC